MAMDDLLLAQQLLLLAMDEHDGSVASKSQMPLEFSLPGALLMELLLEGTLALDGDRASVDDIPASLPPLLAETARMIHATPGKTLAYWMRHVRDGLPDLDAHLVVDLIKRGILEKRETRKLWLFRSTHFAMRDDRPRHDLRQRMETVLLHDGTPDPRTHMLMALADGCHLVEALFPDVQHPRIRQRLAQLGDTTVADGIGNATRRAVEGAAVTAAMSAITAAAAASTAAAGSL